MAKGECGEIKKREYSCIDKRHNGKTLAHYQHATAAGVMTRAFPWQHFEWNALSVPL